MARPEQGTESIHVYVPSATPFVFERTLLLSAGNMDPWHALGIVNKSDPFFNSCGQNTGHECAAQRVRSPSSSIVTIDGTAHCRDMYRPNLFASAEFCGNSSSGATVDSDSEPELEPADEPVATETEPLEPAPALSAEEMPTPPVTPVPLAPLLIFT